LRVQLIRRKIAAVQASQSYWRSAIRVAEGNRALAAHKLEAAQRLEARLTKQLLHAEYDLPPLME
jgi:hypothetical protein